MCILDHVEYLCLLYSILVQDIAITYGLIHIRQLKLWCISIRNRVSLWVNSWNYIGTWVKTKKLEIIHSASQLHSNITYFIKINFSWTSSIAEGILTCLIFQEIDLVSSSGDWLHCNGIFVLLLLLFFISCWSCHNPIQDFSGMIEAKLTDTEVINVRFLPIPSSVGT
jgi:hypothetical protein